MFVTAREGEPFESLYRRFKRGVDTSGVLGEFRRAQRFVPKHEEEREKRRKAEKRRVKADRRDRS